MLCNTVQKNGTTGLAPVPVAASTVEKDTLGRKHSNDEVEREESIETKRQKVVVPSMPHEGIREADGSIRFEVRTIN